MKRLYVLLGIISGIVFLGLGGLVFLCKGDTLFPIFAMSMLLGGYLVFLLFACVLLKKEYQLEMKNKEKEYLEAELLNKQAYLDYQYKISGIQKKEEELEEKKKVLEEETKKLEEMGLPAFKADLAKKANYESFISHLSLYLFFLREKGDMVKGENLKEEFEQVKKYFQELNKFIGENMKMN